MYHEIVPPERLVYTFEFEGLPAYVTLETITFEEEHNGRTKLTSKSFFQTVEDCDMMLNLRMGGGAAESMDRLRELLKYLKYIHKGQYDND
jgi:uncharacterized protein YndB with AHSA1/START domain